MSNRVQWKTTNDGELTYHIAVIDGYTYAEIVENMGVKIDGHDVFWVNKNFPVAYRPNSRMVRSNMVSGSLQTTKKRISKEIKEYLSDIANKIVSSCSVCGV